jgi:nicotinic acid phosphoribosyltransferase
MAQNLSNDHINLTMLTDFYEITMANGYFTNGFKDTIGYFDMFFRKVLSGLLRLFCQEVLLISVLEPALLQSPVMRLLILLLS